jgi:DNA-directed RNA polymerase specialized sigma subunit
MDAKKFLLQIKKLDRLIENKMIEVQQLKELVCNTSPTLTAERVQSSGNPHRMADAIGKYIDLENEINHRIDEFVNAKNDVISVIEQLDATEYDILHKVYVQDFTLYDVAEKYDRTYSWVTTIHGRAIKHVQNILNERKT